VFVHTQVRFVKLVHEPETLVAFVRHLLIQGVRPAVPVLLGTGAVPVLVELPLEDAAFTARAATDTRARRLKLASILRRGSSEVPVSQL